VIEREEGDIMCDVMRDVMRDVRKIEKKYMPCHEKNISFYNKTSLLSRRTPNDVLAELKKRAGQNPTERKAYVAETIEEFAEKKKATSNDAGYNGIRVRRRVALIWIFHVPGVYGKDERITFILETLLGILQMPEAHLTPPGTKRERRSAKARQE
jgi:hypothetical protein